MSAVIASGHKDVTLYELQGFGHKGILVTPSMPLIHDWIERHQEQSASGDHNHYPNSGMHLRLSDACRYILIYAAVMTEQTPE